MTDVITHELGICKTNDFDMPILTSMGMNLGITKKISQEFDLTRKGICEKELEL